MQTVNNALDCGNENFPWSNSYGGTIKPSPFDEMESKKCHYSNAWLGWEHVNETLKNTLDRTDSALKRLFKKTTFFVPLSEK